MTALLSSPTRRPAAAPIGRRLIGGAIVAGIGAVILSVAVGGQVVGTMRDLPAATAADAATLRAAVPWVVVLGLVHVVVGAALATGRDLFRVIAAAITGLAAITLGAAAAMVAAGIDPIGRDAPSVAPAGVAILAVTAALYGAAAALAGTGPVEPGEA